MPDEETGPMSASAQDKVKPPGCAVGQDRRSGRFVPHSDSTGQGAGKASSSTTAASDGGIKVAARTRTLTFEQLQMVKGMGFFSGSSGASRGYCRMMYAKALFGRKRSRWRAPVMRIAEHQVPSPRWPPSPPMRQTQGRNDGTQAMALNQAGALSSLC
jgi:hypothetical protein